MRKRNRKIRCGRELIPEYAIWLAMRQRCLNPNYRQWHRYGGRGISICPEWDDFYKFLKDVGSRPSPEHQLDRINNNGNYEPSNVRWATRHQQMNHMSTTVYVEHAGERLSIGDWALKLGIAKCVIATRLQRGHSAESALSPVPLYNRGQFGKRI